MQNTSLLADFAETLSIFLLKITKYDFHKAQSLVYYRKSSYICSRFSEH